jgi:hypothetical protein
VFQQVEVISYSILHMFLENCIIICSHTFYNIVGFMALVFNILVDHYDYMIYIIHSQPSSHMSISIHPLFSHKSIQVIFVITLEIQLPLQYCPSIISLLSYQYVIPKLGREFIKSSSYYNIAQNVGDAKWYRLDVYNCSTNIARKSNMSKS